MLIIFVHQKSLWDAFRSSNVCQSCTKDIKLSIKSQHHISVFKGLQYPSDTLKNVSLKKNNVNSDQVWL